MEQERDAAAEKVKSLGKEVANLEAQLEALRLGPSEREVLEKDKSMLEKDVQKFHTIVEDLTNTIVMENKRISEENEEAEKRVDALTVNARDAERMKRKLHAMERDIAETELARNDWEEKCWDLDATLAHKLKELENLSIECHHALWR
uniref:Uncharacterized protein n=1 Tax=Nelumbo nucifera TaxID=4432 RepID=A0A822ZFH0_NELNU|nr:TPA_asm: hypothetical protein HUJ06_002092 [Nelumbo nucifera]